MEDSDSTVVVDRLLRLRDAADAFGELAPRRRLLIERDGGAKPKAVAALVSLLFEVTAMAAAAVSRVALRVMVMVMMLCKVVGSDGVVVVMVVHGFRRAAAKRSCGPARES